MIFINGCTSLPVLHRHLEDEQGKIYIGALITEKVRNDYRTCKKYKLINSEYLIMSSTNKDHAMKSQGNKKLQIAVIKWSDPDGISDPIGQELIALGHEVKYMLHEAAIPDDIDLLFSFAPYGRFYPIQAQLSKLPESKRPFFVHWNFESFPNHKIPWKIIQLISLLRSRVDRLNDSKNSFAQYLIRKSPLSLIDRYMHKFRYIGDYQYAYDHGLLDMLFETSSIHATLYNQNGMPATYVPWGISPCWYADLKMKRDIDVLWMGKRRTRRRSNLIDKIYDELQSRGFNMYIADNEVHPFVFDDVRTQFLNRAKITLGLSPSWYDTSYVFRINLAAANRSLFVSEPILPHAPHFIPNMHYVSAPVEDLADTLVYYLTHEDMRNSIAESAYQLVTTDLSLDKSVKTIMMSVSNRLDSRASSTLM